MELLGDARTRIGDGERDDLLLLVGLQRSVQFDKSFLCKLQTIINQLQDDFLRCILVALEDKVVRYIVDEA